MINAVLQSAVTGETFILAPSPPRGSVGRTGVGDARTREGHHDMAFGVTTITERHPFGDAHAFMIARKPETSSTLRQGTRRESRRRRRNQNGGSNSQNRAGKSELTRPHQSPLHCIGIWDCCHRGHSLRGDRLFRKQRRPSHRAITSLVKKLRCTPGKCIDPDQPPPRESEHSARALRYPLSSKADA